MLLKERCSLLLQIQIQIPEHGTRSVDKNYTMFKVFIALTMKEHNKYPSIGNLSITLKGVQKLLGKINISKAAGPDLIPGRMLNMLAPELALIGHAIFTQSLDTGELPRD